ncbi:MAG: hypothetical protein WD069_15425 [Planctomycetales bacterium]
MDMSGIDFAFSVPEGQSASATVLEACRRIWPRCVVRHAEEDVDRPIDDVALWENDVRVGEFFVYRSAADAENWHRNGSTLGNAAGMIHVMIDLNSVENDALPCIIEVHDPEDERIHEILNEIETGFAAPASN